MIFASILSSKIKQSHICLFACFEDDSLKIKFFRLFRLLAQSVFCTSETDLDHCHQSLNVHSPIAKILQIYNLMKSGIFKKSLKCLKLALSSRVARQSKGFIKFTRKLKKMQV